MMERGDLVIQLSWGWHNHINETDQDAIWIDCLDSGLMRMVRDTPEGHLEVPLHPAAERFWRQCGYLP